MKRNHTSCLAPMFVIRRLRCLCAAVAVLLATEMAFAGATIDRKALVERNNPTVTKFDSLSSFTVGNGDFAYTVDATGLQTFPDYYRNGVPLGTQSQWGWHSFANPQGFRPEDAYATYDFGKGHKEIYSTQSKQPQRAKEAADWLRQNPHRLHLGIVGFDFSADIKPSNLTNISQKLDMWRGVINSHFRLNGAEYNVQTVCHPQLDMIAARVVSASRTGICFRFPYPTGGHSDDACCWTADDKHSTDVVNSGDNSVVLKRTLDSTVYYVRISWEGKARFRQTRPNGFVLRPDADSISFSCSFTEKMPDNNTPQPNFAATMEQSQQHWKRFWTDGAAVDFSHCMDKRAVELERRVVLSQYLLALQSAGMYPPQETGLTYNSWFGKFHLEMIWWHEAWLALWNHPAMLKRTLRWYEQAEPMARQIAHRQGYDGVRWMKMTDPSAVEAPSKVGSFLIWQQPHIIYLAELLYRVNPSADIINRYNSLVQSTAEFMYSFATYDKQNDRYILKGFIPAQETLKASTTVNAPFELSYWHFAMTTAQKWRERAGQKRMAEWDEMISKLSSLAYNADSLYLAAENATDTYHNISLTSDHMAVLGAYGVLPFVPSMMRSDCMLNTLNWVWKNWNWDKTWGWDYPMTAMNAARLGKPDMAVDALLMNNRTNTYLPNGHNYQDERLRVYLPGNGGLLTAIAMMCAGWDEAKGKNPGFPADGCWDVRWEGLRPLP